jgi:hypothetical protein
METEANHYSCLNIREEINSELVIHLNDSIQTFKYFAIELDASTDITHFMRDVNRFCVITELVYVEAMKGTAYGEDLYEKLLIALEEHKHTQNTL